MQQYKNTRFQILLFFLLIIPMLIIAYDTTNITQVIRAESNNSLPTTEPLNLTNITSTNCRYGVSSWSNHDNGFLQEAGLGWVLNFGTNFGYNFPDGIEYTPMIRFKPELDENNHRTGNYRVITHPFTDDAGGLGSVIAANPGALWIVGNEVDRVVWQDDLMPDVYAKAYHDTYHFIKERDRSAQVAISGLVEVTPGRLQYLDIVWDSYLEIYGVSMPVDVWNMHLYIFPEIRADGTGSNAAVALGTDPSLAILESGNDPSLCPLNNVYCYAEHDDMDIFAEQVVAMRQWMKVHGQQNKPLILSEYSLLYPYDQEGDDDPSTCYLRDEYGNCFTPERVSQFMTNSFDYLETAADTVIGFPADNHKLIQQWLWFSVSGDEYAPYRLLEADYTAEVYTPTLVGETFIAEVNTIPLVTSVLIDDVSYPVATIEPPSVTVSVTISAHVLNNGNTATTEPITVTFYADEAKTDQIGVAVIPVDLIGCARRADVVQVVWPDLDAGVHPYWAEVDGGNTMAGMVLINPEQTFLPVIIRQ